LNVHVLAEEVMYADLVDFALDFPLQSMRSFGSESVFFLFGREVAKRGVFFFLILIGLVFFELVEANFEAGFECVQLVLKVEIIWVSDERSFEIRDFIDIENKPPLEQIVSEKRRPMLGLGIHKHSDSRVINGNVLGFGKLLLDFNEFVLSHDQHVAQIAYSCGPRGTMVYLWET